MPTSTLSPVCSLIWIATRRTPAPKWGFSAFPPNIMRSHGIPRTLVTVCVSSAVRQRALQQIPLRGSLQICAPERGVSSESASDGLPSSSPKPVPPRVALLQRITSVLLFPPAGLLHVLFLGPQALPSARPSLLHHRLHSHRAQVQRPGQNRAAGHIFSDWKTGWAGLHPTSSPPARAAPSSPISGKSAGLVPSASSSGDARRGGLQGGVGIRGKG